MMEGDPMAVKWDALVAFFFYLERGAVDNVQDILRDFRERLFFEVNSLSDDLGQLVRDVATMRKEWEEFQRVFDARIELVSVRVEILSALARALCNTSTLAGLIDLVEIEMSQNVTKLDAGTVGGDRVVGDAQGEPETENSGSSGA